MRSIEINKSYVNRGNLIFMGTSLITIGFIILYGQTNFLSIVIKIIASAFIINGASNILSILVKKKNQIDDNATIGHAILNLALGASILVLPEVPLSLLSMAFALYLILNGVVKVITIYIYVKNDTRIKIGSFIECLLYFGFGITSFCAPLIHLNEILVIIAIYFFMLGSNFIKDFAREMLPKRTRNKFKRKIRITLPVFLVALVPHKVLKRVNEYFELNSDTTDKINKKCEEDVDLEVFIHATMDGIGVVGHVDLYFNGEMISYGNYDEASYKLFGMLGKGILFTCDKEKYINFCINQREKTLFSYGLKLNDEQKKNVEKKINDIKDNLIEWKPPITFEGGDIDPKDYNDYASLLYQATEAEFFKFKSGKFKTYFGLNTNCVLLADSVIGNSGIDILGIGGIITPGTYYEYLNNEFAKRNSIVVSSIIYR